MMAIRSLYLAIALQGIIVDAIPTISYPINSQVPPVARISEPFSYTFSSSTFSSELPMIYGLTGAPAWISLDSNTRTLSGTPSASDAGTDDITGVSLGVTASDQTGSITLNATIVISRDPPPKVTNPLTAQLPSLGPFSLPSTLLYHPSTAFNLNLDHNTFIATGSVSNLSYYAVTDDNTPLPSWIVFNGNSFSFSGQTPDYASLIQPPQTFGFKLIASDVQGFAGSSISFEIEVGVHLLAFKNENLILEASPGNQTTFNGLSNNLQLDGQMVNISSITSITAQTPSWLSFDNSTLLLTGTVPSDASPGNFTVQATDIYGDTAIATISVDVPGAIFSTNVADFNATIGASFSHDLSNYVRDMSDTDINLSFDPPISWATFDPQTFILSGNVPSDAQPSNITITMNATSKSSQSSASQLFILSLVSVETASSTGVAPPIGTPSTTPGDVVASHHGLNKALIPAIVVPLVFVAVGIIVILAVCCSRRLRKRHKNKNPDYATAAMKQKEKEKAGLSGPSTPSMTDGAVPTPPSQPLPLLLDTSGFGADNRSSAYSEPKSTTTGGEKSIKRSRTINGAPTVVMVGARRPDTAGTSPTSHTHIRSRALSEVSTPNWRAAPQDGSYPSLGVKSRPESISRPDPMLYPDLSRRFSNFSRKGRRNARVWTPDQGLRDSITSTQVAEAASILDFKEGKSAVKAVDDNTTAPRSTDVLHVSKRGSGSASANLPNENSFSQMSRTQRRISKQQQQQIASPLQRTRTGIGHGGRDSISSATSLSLRKRRSIGHGLLPYSLNRENSWMTVDEDAKSGVSSNITYKTDRTESKNARESEITTATSPRTPASISEYAAQRPISRRVDGESSFFSGGSLPSAVPSKIPSFRASRISQLPPEPDLTPETSAAAISRAQYNSAIEGNRQLRSFIQSHSRGISNDSRFESASPSMQSMAQHQDVCDGEGDVEMQDASDDGYEDIIPDDISTGSSPSRRGSIQPNVPGSFPYDEVEKPNPVLTQLKNQELGINARLQAGRGKRPTSVEDASTTTKHNSVRGRVMDRDTSVLSEYAFI